MDPPYIITISNSKNKLGKELYKEEEEVKNNKSNLSIGGMSYKSIGQIYGLTVKIREQNDLSKTQRPFVLHEQPFSLYDGEKVIDEYFFNSSKNINRNLIQTKTDKKKQRTSNPVILSNLRKKGDKLRYTVESSKLQGLREIPVIKEIRQEKDTSIKIGDNYYKGQIINNTMNGIGELFNKEYKSIYIGGFENGKFDGVGKLNNLEGEHTVERGKEYYEDLNEVGNCWINYEGLFRNGDRDGIGYLYISSGDVFLGEFSHNKANGFGIYTSSTQKVCGLWKDNILIQSI